jgi:hypothetical protein
VTKTKNENISHASFANPLFLIDVAASAITAKIFPLLTFLVDIIAVLLVSCRRSVFISQMLRERIIIVPYSYLLIKS